MPTELLFGRRPPKKQSTAFGHIDLSKSARSKLASVVVDLARHAGSLTPVAYHPDDEADAGEVLRAPLSGIDSFFQPNAAWSIERAISELRSPKLPTTLSAAAVASEQWGFYVARATYKGQDAAIIRTKSPTWGLDTKNKVLGLVGGNGELRPADGPVVAIDHQADAVIIDGTIYILHPRSMETQFVDAEAVKARGPATATKFKAGIAATLSTTTEAAVARVCSHNANVGRRVERLLKDGTLKNVTAARVRDALPDAGLQSTDFGPKGKPIDAVTDDHAKTLIDIAADLFYQPRFDGSPRRVASYRKMKK